MVDVLVVHRNAFALRGYSFYPRTKSEAKRRAAPTERPGVRSRFQNGHGRRMSRSRKRKRRRSVSVICNYARSL